MLRALRFIRKVLRYPLRLRNYLKLRNKNFTLIAKDCTGGMLLHELFQRFDTPIINARFRAGDFVKFCSDLQYYISQELIEDKDNSAKEGYPVGILGLGDREIRVWFMHDYANFSEARTKWIERCKRIHWDNIYFIMTDSDGSNQSTAEAFDSLPHKHKALLTYRDFDGVSSAVKLKHVSLADYGFGATQVFAFKSRFSFKRVIDDWDYVGFLNS